MQNIPAESPCEPLTGYPRKGTFDWAKLERHLKEVGALHASVYRVLRDLVPAMVLTAYWLYKHPTLLFARADWWAVPRISMLELAMLAGVTLLSSAVTGREWETRPNVLHTHVSASLLAALICSIAIYPCLLAKMDTERALTFDASFFVGCSVLSLSILAIACVAGWLSIDTIVARRDVLIVGSGRSAQAIFEELVDSPVYRVVGILDQEFHGPGSMRSYFLGGLDRLDPLLKENPISVIFCSLPVKSMYAPIQQVIEVCERFGVEVRHSTHLFQTSIARLERGPEAHYSILRMVREDWTRYVKRAVDIAGAFALLLISLPLMLGAGIAIKLTSPGPIFFAQDRYGLYRRRFRMYKLRSMVTNAEALQKQLENQNELGGPVFKIKRDPRITKVGAFLRKTSIDELPQLWNVLKGDMSLVGPRPLAVRDVLLIEDSAQLRRFSVKPGITCIWQMSGRNNTDFAGWIRQDLEYIDSWSIWLDIKILFGTVPAVLKGKGAM